MIEYVPAGDVFERIVPLTEHVEAYMSPYIKSGRAVFAVVLKGFIGRDNPPARGDPPVSSIKFRDEAVDLVTDLRRGLDYLETRDDIDHKRMIYWGYSAGAEWGLLAAAIENRYQAVVLMSVGLNSYEQAAIAEANRVNFAPHIKAPKLMLNGRYDEQFAFKTEAEPLFRLLREPKRLELHDGGHTAPPETAVPVISRWLDETSGKARR